MLYNYRGYGRSQGKPSPSALKRDGEVLINYMRDIMNIKKIGVHGASIGGMVANHIARKKGIDLLVADRTFSSLSNVAYYLVNKVLYSLFVGFTHWTYDSSKDFVDSNCYKVLLYDARDELVVSMSSLKYGVTQEIIKRKIEHDRK